MAKPRAEWVKCAGYNPDYPAEHEMRDHCWTCAPWWTDVPICVKGHKLQPSGFCLECRKFYDLTGEPV